MRILMASHGYPPTVSGVTLVVRKIARAMVARGHQVTVVTGSDRVAGYEAEDEGVRLIRVRSLGNPFWKEGPIPFISRTELDRIAEEVNPDILHLHDAALLAMQFIRLSRRASLPLISTCYYVPGFVSQYVGGQTTETLIEKAAWGYSVWLFNQCDRVVFATLAHRQEFLTHGLEAPTTIISNGIDTHRYSRSNSQDNYVEQVYHLPPRPRVLFVGRLAKDKRIEVTIQAMRYVVDEMDAHFLLVGRGDYQKCLESLVRELSLQNNVHFLGFVPE
ncbi:MAG: glycosyltransferase family 4 protein, partial [Chloroflexi bacterium]|nr:glycosyltransferase family 4 protein [Chloroflexota bacterium]